jgi:hypothetical protein
MLRSNIPAPLIEIFFSTLYLKIEFSFHTGVILLRLLDERGKNKVRCLKYLLHELGDELISKFVVVTDKGAQIQHRIRL